MIYGYARVSTTGQSMAAQVAALKAAGAATVFREVASGAKTDRAQLRKTLVALDADDVLTVTRLYRLARSTRDLSNTLAAVAAMPRTILPSLTSAGCLQQSRMPCQRSRNAPPSLPQATVARGWPSSLTNFLQRILPNSVPGPNQDDRNSSRNTGASHHRRLRDGRDRFG
jgi:hypothetical protein